jgi:hypothetical protein
MLRMIYISPRQIGGVVLQRCQLNILGYLETEGEPQYQ